MSQPIAKYFAELSSKYSTGQAREHAYRPVFESLIKSLDPKLKILNDPSPSEHGNPDFVFLRGDITVGYVETKDIGVDLDKTEKTNQMERYLGYSNLILTDYLEFRFFRNGARYGEAIRIGKIKEGTLEQNTESFDALADTLSDFLKGKPEPIKSGRRLAEIMGGKARRIRDNVKMMLASNNASYADLLKMRDVVKEHLVSTLDDESFADMYAQTLVYGLFAARYNDKTPDDFSRAEARELVPKTNPFLRSFFDHIAGESFPERLQFIVDELCEVFTHADVHKLMHEYFTQGKLMGGVHRSPDPVIHFYEDFLLEYDAKKKMEMGVFYTPRPVVQFIIRAVDNILKSEFGLEKGLADTAKITIEKKETNGKGKEIKVQKEYHKVQILDVATGTGTFLNEVIRYIHLSFIGQEGRWPAYVEKDLLPRLHGFELMMASYTIAHLKLGMTLHDTGAGSINTRLGVYLTDTLEAPVDYTNQNTLFGIMDSIAQESKNASRVKSEYPIMCVIGNPPYSGESMNPGYTNNDVYKVEPGGKEKLKERNSKWINDDYVKFIRFAESLIEKNGEGVIGMITAHGYIDNPTFRGMRWHLRKTFDKIYIIDLHGNSRKKEVSPDGSKDENVFDIMSGVSIILGLKKSDNSKNRKPAVVYVSDMYGTRDSKFQTLDTSDIENIKWAKLPDDCDVWKVEGENKSKYGEGFSVSDLFIQNGVGVTTAHDDFVIKENKEDLLKLYKDFQSTDRDEELLHSKFNVKKKAGWKILIGYDNIKNETNLNDFIKPISYRPFDNRYIFYEDKLVWRTVRKVMKNVVDKKNILLITNRQVKSGNWNHVFISKNITESSFVSNKTGEIGSIFPLYIYGENDSRVPNLDKKILEKINGIVGKIIPEDIFDYVYAVLHSLNYREEYKEFLRTDFPRVPYPKNKEEFWRLVPLGMKLRELHLMGESDCNNLITTYSQGGTDVVEKLKYENGNVCINNTQYFGNVPEVAWNFYIGAYQPAQKWLKDRKGRTLSNDEIEHYQKMIVALVETARIMGEIDKID